VVRKKTKQTLKAQSLEVIFWRLQPSQDPPNGGGDDPLDTSTKGFINTTPLIFLVRRKTNESDW
jgi:hypothetical protein